MKPKDFPTNCKFFPPDISLLSYITTLCLWEGREESSIPRIIVKTKKLNMSTLLFKKYRGADKSLALLGRKQANVSVRMA